MAFATCDLCDQYENQPEYGLRVVEPMFKAYGGRTDFYGPVTTLKLFEDNSLVRATLSEPGNGHVLVVDGGGSRRCALVGDQLGELAVKNGWAGMIVYGCIRDSTVIAGQAIGIRALDTHPKKSVKAGVGQRDLAVAFGSVIFSPGDWVYVDADGVVVTKRAVPPL